MTVHPTEVLNQNLVHFAQLSEEDIDLAKCFWTHRYIPQNAFFNFRNSVYRHVGFIVKGLFRVYYVDLKTEIEHNIFFIAENTFMVSLKAF